MERHTRPALRIVALLVAFTAGALFPFSHSVVAQMTGLKDGISVSPTWGYTVRWYASEWTVAEESSDGQTDILTLQDSLGNTVSFFGTPQFAGDAAACLDDLVAQVLAIPGAADPETVMDDFGQPFEGRQPQQAYTLMQVRVPVAGVLQDHAVYLECQTLVPGVAVFQRVSFGPVAIFDQWYDTIVATLEGVFLPASAWQPMPDAPQVWTGSAPLRGDMRTNADLVVNAAGEPLLLVGLADAADDIRIVTFENVAAVPVTIDPANLVLAVSSMGEEIAGPIQPPYAVIWEDDANANAGSSRVLQPGERATVQVAIAPFDESTIVCDGLPSLTLQYRHPASETATIASSLVESCMAEVFAEQASLGRPMLRLSR